MRDILREVVRPVFWCELGAGGLFFVMAMVWAMIGSGA